MFGFCPSIATASAITTKGRRYWQSGTYSHKTGTSIGACDPMVSVELGRYNDRGLLSFQINRNNFAFHNNFGCFSAGHFCRHVPFHSKWNGNTRRRSGTVALRRCNSRGGVGCGFVVYDGKLLVSRFAGFALFSVFSSVIPQCQTTKLGWLNSVSCLYGTDPPDKELVLFSLWFFRYGSFAH